MSDDKPESTIDMPFQASSDACVMVKPRRVELHTVSACRIFPPVLHSFLKYRVFLQIRTAPIEKMRRHKLRRTLQIENFLLNDDAKCRNTAVFQTTRQSVTGNFHL